MPAPSISLSKFIVTMRRAPLPLLVAVVIVGCAAPPPPRPVYKIQVGWTKERVLKDSKYRDQRKTISTVAGPRGTIEIWSFGRYGEVPSAIVYFDFIDRVVLFNCLSDCD